MSDEFDEKAQSLFAKADLTETVPEAEAIIANALRAAFEAGRVKGLKEAAPDVIAFLGPWADQYQRLHQLNGFHPTHYDLLEKYGARMTDFKRATNAPEPRK